MEKKLSLRDRFEAVGDTVLDQETGEVSEGWSNGNRFDYDSRLAPGYWSSLVAGNLNAGHEPKYHFIWSSGYGDGDLLAATRGETKVSGRAASFDDDIYIAGTGWTVSRLFQGGFVIEVIEKAPKEVKLPTRPGIYKTWPDGSRVNLMLTPDGQWYYLDKDGQNGKADRRPEDHVKQYADRLEYLEIR